jgi:geranylgeranyl diphosphate synthase type I
MSVATTTDDLSSRVETELHGLLDPRRMELYRMMSYHLGWEGDRGGGARYRSHGVACLTACALVGGGVDVALPAAAALELVNGFCEIHDDVQGGQPQRNDRDSVWWVWGPAQAINAGDGMHALARTVLFTLQQRGVSVESTFRAVQMMDEASLELCEGRFRDLEAQERIDLDIDGYMGMAASKTGSLYSCAMKLGGLVAGAQEPVIDALGAFGGKIGLAAQVRGDLGELWGSAPDDANPAYSVLNKKKLLPVVYAVTEASISQKRRLGDIYFKRVLEPDDVAAVRQLLEELGARDYCEELIDRLRSEAMDALGVAGIPDDGMSSVARFADSLLT